LADQAVIVVEGGVAQWPIALKDDHGSAVGIELVEICAKALHRHQRWGVVWRQRHRVLFADHL
jgi:hypothetical protein